MDTLSCIDCGCLYVSPTDLQKHVKRGCPEADDDDKEIKRQKYESDNESEAESEESYIDDEEQGFAKLLQKAYDRYYDLYHDKKEELLKNMNNKQAEQAAYSLLRSKYRKSVIKQYKLYLEMRHLMQSSPVSCEIINDIKRNVHAGYKFKESVDRSIKENKNLFDEMLDHFNADKSESDTDYESESEGESESD